MGSQGSLVFRVQQDQLEHQGHRVPLDQKEMPAMLVSKEPKEYKVYLELLEVQVSLDRKACRVAQETLDTLALRVGQDIPDFKVRRVKLGHLVLQVR